MSETKFTKGPWRIDPYYGKEAQRATHPNVCIIYASDSLSPICRVPIRKAEGEPNTPANVTERDEANARLIAAAPELYEALEAAMLDLGSLVKDERCDHAVGICWCGTYRTLDAAAAALKKARGEQ